LQSFIRTNLIKARHYLFIYKISFIRLLVTCGLTIAESKERVYSFSILGYKKFFCCLNLVRIIRKFPVYYCNC